MKTYILFIGCFIIALASIYIYFYFLAQSLPNFFSSAREGCGALVAVAGANMICTLRCFGCI